MHADWRRWHTGENYTPQTGVGRSHKGVQRQIQKTIMGHASCINPLLIEGFLKGTKLPPVGAVLQIHGDWHINKEFSDYTSLTRLCWTRYMLCNKGRNAWFVTTCANSWLNHNPRSFRGSLTRASQNHTDLLSTACCLNVDIPIL